MQLTFKELVKEQVPPQAIITAAFVVMLTVGYGVWTSETSGSFTVTAPLYSTEVYVDSGRAGALQTPGEKMTFDYPAGEHTVIVSRGGYWPWKKDLNIIAKKTVSLDPFLVQQDIKPEIIPQFSVVDGTATEDPAYMGALALFSDLKIANDLLPLISATALKDVRAADYFPGRKDVLLVAVQNGIFAVDAVQNDPRNFQPIYQGNSPVFIKTADGMLLIKDGDSLFRIAKIN